MPTRPLPARPSLEHLRNQAKDLLKSYRAGHPPAIVRIREALPRLSAVPGDRLAQLPLSLRDAQRVVAAEHGFASWSRLRTYIERKENIQMLEVTIDQIRVNPASHQRIVVLKAKGVDRCLPIWIGSAEADSIALKLEGKELPRPMTHDLMGSMISDLGATVTRVIVSELREDTFIARVVLQRNGTTLERDSRPSDAIALAVRCGAPMFAEEDVLERAGVALDPDTGEPDSADARWPAFSVSKQGDALSEDARNLLTQAGVEAKRMGRREAEPEDMLLALVGEAGGLGARVLSDLGAVPQAIQSTLEGRLGIGGPAHHAHVSPAAAEESGPEKEQIVEHQDHDAPTELSPAGPSRTAPRENGIGCPVPWQRGHGSPPAGTGGGRRRPRVAGPEGSWRRDRGRPGRRDQGRVVGRVERAGVEAVLVTPLRLGGARYHHAGRRPHRHLRAT